MLINGRTGVYFPAYSGSIMQLDFVSYQLSFKHPFGVSSNTRRETTSVFIRISAGNQCGYGEACLPAYLGETEEETIVFLKKMSRLLQQYDAVMPLRFFLDEAERMDKHCNAAKAAVDIALHDLYGKLAKVSYRAMMGIEEPQEVRTSFTIGIDSEDKLRQKIEEARDFHILKIKAGTADDKALISLIRKFTDKPLFVDVNQGWTDRKKVLHMLEWMEDQNVLLVEQPMPKELDADMRWVTERSPVPTIADESVKRLKDLELMNHAFHGINIKLMKCTGLREAMKMISFCRKHQIQVMLGCMAESSCATTAMANLVSMADFVDLDAPLLYVNDPFRGLTYRDGCLVLPDAIGTGADPLAGLFDT